MESLDAAEFHLSEASLDVNGMSIGSFVLAATVAVVVVVVVVFQLSPSHHLLFIAKMAEILLPLLFCLVLVILTELAEDSEHFKPKHIKARFSSDLQTVQMFSFTDYVKALEAKRICLNRTSANHNSSSEELSYFRNTNHSNFDISGMPNHGKNWQVPFVQCDSRRCQYHGEEAYQYCHYPKLGLAPSVVDDTGGSERLLRFRDYIYERYPQLQNSSLPAFRSNNQQQKGRRSTGEFIQLFESNQAIEEYTQHPSYGIISGLPLPNNNNDRTTDYMDRPKLAMAVIFTGSDKFNYDYTIRINSTNHNAPEWGRKGGGTSRTTPDTKRLFAHYAKQELEVCGRHVHGHAQGLLQYSCTGQYMVNGLLVMQRFLHDWILVDSGAHDRGYFVAEHGAKFTALPSKAYLAEGFYTVLNGTQCLFLDFYKSRALLQEFFVSNNTSFSLMWNRRFFATLLDPWFTIPMCFHDILHRLGKGDGTKRIFENDECH